MRSDGNWNQDWLCWREPVAIYSTDQLLSQQPWLGEGHELQVLARQLKSSKDDSTDTEEYPMLGAVT
jgi:hypothetical protein